jgi:excisionase family DNA binding protein
MAKENKISFPPGYVSTETAAAMLRVSPSRIYQLVDDDRLTPYQVGKAFCFKIEQVEGVVRNPIGRATTKIRSWRAYKGKVKVIGAEITVQVRAGQQERLTQKLQAMQVADQYRFPGTIARYIFRGDEQTNTIQIFLIWKSTTRPTEAIFQGHLSIFQQEFEDVLDWGTAQIRTKEALSYT